MEPRSEDVVEFEAYGARLLSLMKREITTLLMTYGPQLSVRPCSTHEAGLFNSFSQLLQMMRNMSSSPLPARHLTLAMQPSSPSTTTPTLTPPSELKPSVIVEE
jgi:hypothetical protein